MRVAITGASGSMGKPTLEEVMNSGKCEHIKVLLLNDTKSKKYARKIKKIYTEKKSRQFGATFAIIKTVYILPKTLITFCTLPR